MWAMLAIAWPVVAQAVTFDTLGHTGADGDLVLTNSDEPVWNITDNVSLGITYTASEGDSATSIAVWIPTANDSFLVGIYTYSGGVPVTKISQDTITSASTGWQTRSLPVKRALTAATKYTYAACNLNRSNVAFKRFGDGVSNLRTNTGISGLPSSYSQNDNYSGFLSVYIVISQYGAASSNPTTGGGNMVIGGNTTQ
jgi:hypothetical protein